jgi:glycosyltransferase involved in cell wall biosynthesis
MPAVTIGLPFRNNERTLLAAIRSVFAQTSGDWELVLVDDGSSDTSLDIARAVRDPRVRLEVDGTNLGLAARLNQITLAANGRYVARMDADDLMHPDRLAMQVAVLDADRALDLVASAAYVIDDDDRIHAVAGAGPYRDRPVDFLSNHVFIHPTVMARREWMAKHPYDARFRRGQDKELWCRTFRTSNFAKISDTPLLFFRDFKGFSLSTYRATRRADREIIGQYGPKIVGNARAFAMARKTHAKVGLYAALHAARIEGVLLRRRYEPMTALDRTRGEQGLADVMSAQVPMFTASEPPPVGATLARSRELRA